MSKPMKCQKQITSEEACEIIELASYDIEVLAKAFQVISDVCRELNNPALCFEGTPEKRELH